MNLHTRLLFCLLIFYASSTYAQEKGLFVKIGLGVGYNFEQLLLKSSKISIPTKNHAIGWGITDKFALQIGEFGGLINQKVKEYNYINLDTFGVGFSYDTPLNLKISIIGGVSTVHFAKKWSEPFGENGENGFGINISIDKEWLLGNRWAVQLGPQLFWIKTDKTDYEFSNISLNGSLIFYFIPFR